ncbi:Uncharacterised protein [Sphingobacterium multivorum]|uniref:Uncharacterized protein n=1 Tax=Sphingobacterium multivorum TaxID=28454 RepID=A0A2X2JFU3_SPHMU|nr:Uncharacterised protein [Sphingobacterium multivorum]
MDGRNRADVKPGMLVNIILKKGPAYGKSNRRHCEGLANIVLLSFEGD